MTKLDWNYDDALGCEVAFHNGYRIKAERDDSPSNPFEEWDGNWPIAIYYDRSIKVYEKTKGVPIRDVLSRFTDAQLVHDQKAIEKLLQVERIDLHLHGIEWDEDASPPKWVTDGAALRSWFEDGLGNFGDSELFDVYAELYKLLGIPVYSTTSRGYSQGDWANVLVVATPEAAAEFGCKEITDKDLESTADLYGYWAWGDVYGYVIEKPIFDEDGEIEDWEDACDHNSCWGYYGDDHAESGLEEAALESVPEEPVRSPDNVLEDA